MNYTAKFNSAKELKDFYECFAFKMKPRSSGRTKIERETKLFASFILNCINNPFWKYPVTIIYDDRPDFVIQSETGKIGVEITEQKSVNYGQALSMLEGSDGFMMKNDFQYSENEKKLKGKDIAPLVSKKIFTGYPSMGYEMEENWVKRILNTAKEKEDKYKKYPNWENFKENILVIFDVRPEYVDFNDVTEEMLEPLYKFGKSSIFHKIHCLDSHFVTINLKSKSFEFRLRP